MSKNGNHQAVILSGGGANGAYEVGVLKALFAGKSPATKGRPIDPRTFTGTSIGSFNASYLVSQWDEYGSSAITQLERVWLERMAEGSDSAGNGAFRFRYDPLEAANPRAYVPNPAQPFTQFLSDSLFLAWDGLQRAVDFTTSQGQSFAERLTGFLNFSSFVSNQPWRETIRSEVQFENIRATQVKLRVAATDWAAGKVVVFENHDMTDNRGLEAIMASSALPGFFPTVEVGAIPFVDGGVLMMTPLKPAIRAGAEELHVIYMDPDIKNIPIERLENTLSTLYRMQLIAWAHAVNSDVARADGLNRGLAALRRIGQGDRIATLADEEEAKLEELLAFAPKYEQRLRDRMKEIKEAVEGLHKAADSVDEDLRLAVEGSRDKVGFYRPLVIHRYHPTEDLGGILGFLNLRRDRLESLIDQGFHDALYHDCKASGCVGVEDA